MVPTTSIGGSTCTLSRAVESGTWASAVPEKSVHATAVRSVRRSVGMTSGERDDGEGSSAQLGYRGSRSLLEDAGKQHALVGTVQHQQPVIGRAFAVEINAADADGGVHAV